MKFNAWLRRQTRRSDEIGELAKVMTDDPDWPQSQDLGLYVKYVESQGAGDGTKQVVWAAWQEWNHECGREKRKNRRKMARASRKRNRRRN